MERRTANPATDSRLYWPWWTYLGILAALAFVAFWPGRAHAQGGSTAVVTWTNPTQYSDGSTLAASAITKTRVEYGTNTSGTGCTFGAKAGEGSTTGNAATLPITGLAPGSYAFRAYTTASGVESVASAPACKVVAQPAPNAPNGVTINVTITVALPP